MIPLRNSKLSELIVERLSEKGSMTASQLLTAGSIHKRKYSQAALYKELANLIEEGVIVKEKTQYTLSVNWIMELQIYAEKLKETFLTAEYLKHYLPPEGKKHTWNFNSLVALDHFWNHLLLALIVQSESQVVCSWVPHPWYVLIHAHQEKRLNSIIEKSGAHIYTMIGGSTYLDHLIEKLYKATTHSYSFSQGPFQKQSNLYFDVIDDAILKVEITPGFSRKIDIMFKNIKSKREVDPVTLLEILTKKTPIKLTLKKDARYAKITRKKFIDFFGITGK